MVYLTLVLDLNIDGMQIHFVQRSLMVKLYMMPSSEVVTTTYCYHWPFAIENELLLSLLNTVYT
jgi:hypothetical protein